MNSHQRKLVITFLVSVVASVIAIIHGIFFDLDLSQIKRISIGGFFATLILIYPTLLALEWLFDLENHEHFKNLEQRISKLEKKKRKN